MPDLDDAQQLADTHNTNRPAHSTAVQWRLDRGTVEFSKVASYTLAYPHFSVVMKTEQCQTLSLLSLQSCHNEAGHQSML